MEIANALNKLQKMTLSNIAGPFLHVGDNHSFSANCAEDTLPSKFILSVPPTTSNSNQRELTESESSITKT